MLSALGISSSAVLAGRYTLGTQKKSKKVLSKSLLTCYNTPMKEISYTILNPFSAQSIMDNVPSDRLDEMVAYFAWMLGVSKSSLIIKETA